MLPDRCLHVCLLGEPGCGLSSLLRAFRGPEDTPDAAIENMVVSVEVDGEPWRVRFTDNTAQPCFQTVRHVALGSAHVVLLCFAIDSQESWERVRDTHMPLHMSTGSEAPAFVLGLRGDLRGLEDRAVVEEDVCHQVAGELGALGYLECSAVHPETVSAAMAEALSAAKDFFTVQWQLPSAGAENVAAMAAAAKDDEPFWLAHECQNVHDDPRPLDREVLRKSLSMLGRTPTRSHAYLRSDLAGLGLTSLDALRGFQHLQFVNVSRNHLRTLEPLSALRNMLQLNASHNVLMRTDCFTAPDYLEVVDLSYNMIGDLGDWGVHKYLRELNLRGNFVSRIGPGLKQNKELRTLDLSENYISRIENLDGLHIATLHLAQNRLSSLEGVSSLERLQALNVRHNSVTSIAALKAEDLPRLRKLCVADNRISQISEVALLESFPVLADLLLAPNPVVELPYYRSQVLHRLPNLRSLDAEPVPAEEKVKADLIYGTDTEARKEIFEELLPKETFVDRRLITEEQIRDMETADFGQQGDAGPYGHARHAREAAPGDRDRVQEAKLRHRLAIARRGGKPAGVADFKNFPAPFAAITVHDEDLPLVLEAAVEGGVKRLLLGSAKLSTDSIRQLVSVLGSAPGELRRVELSGCPAVGELEKELLNSFPFARGCSLVAPDCGLTPAGYEKLQNREPLKKG